MKSDRREGFPIKYGAEVNKAISAGIPVVALETTILSHGLPYPFNLETCKAVELAVAEVGAVPATIGIVDGKIRVGLTQDEIEYFAVPGNARKLSRADLPSAIATKCTGSTTVAATMICAKLAGIDVFATGGIGGVHHDARNSFDVSADLHEFVHSPVVVVASGAKAILDIPKTLEVLETLGVPVFAYRQDDFPAFWSRSSEYLAPARIDDPQGIAETFLSMRGLGLSGGMLVANPIPEDSEIPNHVVRPWIDNALRLAEACGIKGKDVTPFLLSDVSESSQSRSLAANAALVRSNARLAGEIAIALTDLKN